MRALPSARFDTQTHPQGRVWRARPDRRHGHQPGSEKTQQGVAGKRQWLVNDLGAKRDLLKAGLGWGHLPRHLVAEDLVSGQLVELERRAWHLRPLTFVVSQRRGHDLSACEARLVEVLGEA
jgi:DNA-binding transcriptional LysR family regulator